MYIRNFGIYKPEVFEERLRKSSNVCNTELAFWIKSRNNQTHLLVVPQAPSRVHVPGEGNVKVNPYKKRPTLCTNFFENGHVAKQCKNPVRCSKCGGNNKLAECAEALAKCLYCKREHLVGVRGCLKQKQEESICEIKHKEKMN